MLYFVSEPGASQYADAVPDKSGIYDARYVPAPDKFDSGNRLIEALPHPRSREDVHRAYSVGLPGYSKDAVKDMTPEEIRRQIRNLRYVRFELPFAARLEEEVYYAIISSYRARKFKHTDQGVPVFVNDEEKRQYNLLFGDSKDPTYSGISLIGLSGCGKSSAVSILVSHYPQVISHEEENWRFVQIVYLVVNCPTNSNFSSLYQAVGEAVDKALGNFGHEYEREVERARTLGQKADKVRALIEYFSIGLIIFDEIQEINFGHTRDNTFDSLLNLANRTKVGFMVVGTEDARAKMFSELRTSRRVGTFIDANQYCTDPEFSWALMYELFQYQWGEDHLELTDEIFATFYQITRGIVDQVIDLYIQLWLDYTNRKVKPVIDEEHIRYIAKNYCSATSGVLGDMSGSDDAYKAALKCAPVMKAIREDEACQSRSAREITDRQNLDYHKQAMLSRITDKVMDSHPEYTAGDVGDAFAKVISRKASSGLDETDILAKVLEELEKLPRRSGSKPKNNAKGKKNSKVLKTRDELTGFVGITPKVEKK